MIHIPGSVNDSAIKRRQVLPDDRSSSVGLFGGLAGNIKWSSWLYYQQNSQFILQGYWYLAPQPLILKRQHIRLSLQGWIFTHSSDSPYLMIVSGCQPGVASFFQAAIMSRFWCPNSTILSRFQLLRRTVRGASRLLRTSAGNHTAMARQYSPIGVDHVEDIEDYRPGGYHPVHLGDVLDGRYRILHKLGSGGFSTTRLARDNVGYHALKILKTDEAVLSTELKTLQRLAKLQTVHPKNIRIRGLTDHFVLHGPNGQHNCLVTEVAGPSMHDIYNVPGHGYDSGSRRFRVDIAHKIMLQVVEAVVFLHSHEICHGGRDARCTSRLDN